MKQQVIIICAFSLLLYGCATAPYSVPVSRQAIEQSPGEGIPYYLPHPYLVVTKNFEGKTVTESKTAKKNEEGKDESVTEATKTEPAEIDTNRDVYAMQVIYLPDSTQKYALKFKRGWGSYKASINLVDGWKLSGLNAEGDAKTAETISAIGTAVKDIASAKQIWGGATNTIAATLSNEQRNEFENLFYNQLLKETKSPPSGIWVYDLMGEKAFDEVFSWP